MRSSLLCLCWMLCGTLSLFSQGIPLSGQIVDDETDEPLVGVSIRSLNQAQGTYSNEFGYFTLYLRADTHTLKLNYPYYQTITPFLTFKRDSSVIFRLRRTPTETIEIVAERLPSPISVINIPIDELINRPTLLGEVDLLKAVALQPGVSTGPEGSAGLYVRGGDPGQNLILLDGATVYNANHLFGFLSAFNADAIKRIQVYKGAFPSRYGGRLSGIVDLQMKEGSLNKRKRKVKIGMLSSSFVWEQGLDTNHKTGFLLAARSAYANLFLLPQYALFQRGQIDNTQSYWLYDINAKLRHQIDSTSQLQLSFYNSLDRFSDTEGNLDYTDFQQKNALTWANQTATIRYQKQLNHRFFVSAMGLFSHYQYAYINQITEKDSIGPDNFIFLTEGVNVNSRLLDLGLDVQAQFVPNNFYRLKVGIQTFWHQFQPSISRFVGNQVDITNPPLIAQEGAAFIDNTIALGRVGDLQIGLRSSHFWVDKQYFSALEPRIRLNIEPVSNWGLSVGGSRMQQYLHLLSSNGFGLPNDLWVPSTDRVPPASLWEVNTGIYFQDLGWQIQLEGYYKLAQQLIDYQQGVDAGLRANTDWQDLITSGGKGKMYGAETLIRKTSKRLMLQLAYTLSWNFRQFNSINGGKWYPARYDRRHDLAFTGQFRLNDRWHFSLNGIYASGHAVSLPVAAIQHLNGNPFQEILVYEDRNNARMPAYHRVDIGVQRTKTTKGGKLATWSFSVYNLYNRANPYYLDFEQGGRFDDPFGEDPVLIESNRSLKQVSLIPILPSISYEISF